MIMKEILRKLTDKGKYLIQIKLNKIFIHPPKLIIDMLTADPILILVRNLHDISIKIRKCHHIKMKNIKIKFAATIVQEREN